MAQVTLRQNQFVDVHGKVDGDYQLGSEKWSDPNDFISIEPIPGEEDNPLAKRITALKPDTTGATSVTVELDGDPDNDQSRPLIGVLNLIINNKEATVFELEVSEPKDVP